MKKNSADNRKALLAKQVNNPCSTENDKLRNAWTKCGDEIEDITRFIWYQ